MTLDKIKNDVYTDNKLLSDVARKYDINITRTPKIDRFYSDDVLNSQVLFKLFSDISNNKILSPIYISNDDVLLVRMKKYYEPKQLDINSSEAAIKALLITQKSSEALSKEAALTLSNLNKGLNLSYDKFSLYMYDKVYSDEIIEIISNQGITNNFVSTKIKSGDYVFVKVDSIIEDIDKKKIEEDNFMDYLENTQSESDYNSLYISKYNNFDIDINTNFLNQ